MPITAGPNSQMKPPLPSPRWSMMNTGADSTYTKNPLKLSAMPTASSMKAGWEKTPA